MTNQAITYNEYGKPAEVLQCVSQPVAEPEAGQVLLKMVAAVINPSDFGQILGSYGSLKEIPAVAGREGIAEIIQVGSGVTDVQVGQKARIPAECGAWQTYMTADASTLQVVPDDIDAEQLAMSFINPPTAYRILEDFVELQPGDWIIQNAANSAVGIAMIQLAAARGIKTINVVRREELIAPLKELGADIVVLDEDAYPKQLKELTGGKKPRLALNSVGGESATRQIKCLADGGTHVTIGAMSFEAARFPTRFLIFNDVQLRGFWLDHWLREASKEETAKLYQSIYDLMKQGVLQTPVSQRFQLDAFAEALEASQAPRLGKVIFTGA